MQKVNYNAKSPKSFDVVSYGNKQLKLKVNRNIYLENKQCSLDNEF